MGLEKQVELAKEGKCAICAEIINQDDFKDSISLLEYSISGLCQKCQDEIWGK